VLSYFLIFGDRINKLSSSCSKLFFSFPDVLPIFLLKLCVKQASSVDLYLVISLAQISHVPISLLVDDLYMVVCSVPISGIT
jgi:hypothetical protein